MSLFLLTLQKKLSDELSKEEVDNYLSYYTEYFHEQKKKGLSEEEILAALGDPNLIAKSILENEERGALHASSRCENCNRKNSGSHSFHGPSYEGRSHRRFFCLPSWLITLLFIVILCCLGYLFFTLFKLVYPAILFISAVLLICYILKNWKRR